MNNRREFIRNLAALWFASQAQPLLADTSKRLDKFNPEIWDAPAALGRITRKTADLNVVRREATDLVVKWGRKPGRLNRKKEISGVGSLTVTMDRLRPNKQFYYQVGTRAKGEKYFNFSDPQKFQTQRTNARGFSFAFITDTHVHNGPARMDYYDHLVTLADMVAKDDVDFVVFGGDELDINNAHNLIQKGVSSQSETNQRWAFWRHIYAPILATKPAFFTMGNHDGERAFEAEVINKGRVFHWQKWATIARKQYVLNPRHDTYPEGGENNGWLDPIRGGAAEGNSSPLENYYAFSWGNALFVVLDVERYTPERPDTPDGWILGEEQMLWLEKTLKESKQKFKFVMGHRIVGGAPYNSNLTGYGVKSRGGAKWSHIGDQARIHELMKRHGAQFYLYGHDHCFALSQRDRIQYISGGRARQTPYFWMKRPLWKDLYSDAEYHAVPGYTVFDVNRNSVTVKYKFAGLGDYPVNRLIYDGREYPVVGENQVELDSEALQLASVWDPNDKGKRNLADKFNGSIQGNKISFQKDLPEGMEKVKAMYVGQETFRRTFRYNRDL
jgi:predicted phosphodiesterase